MGLEMSEMMLQVWQAAAAAASSYGCLQVFVNPRFNFFSNALKVYDDDKYIKNSPPIG